jgi:hypothetical protein
MRNPEQPLTHLELGFGTDAGGKFRVLLQQCRNFFDTAKATHGLKRSERHRELRLEELDEKYGRVRKEG